MKHFSFKQFTLDLERRAILEKHYSKLWGRKADFSEVLRDLMAEKVSSLQK